MKLDKNTIIGIIISVLIIAMVVIMFIPETNKILVDFNCIPNKYYDIIVQELLNCNIV